MPEEEQVQTVAELVREYESDYIRGNVTISKYVQFDMYETINTIEAYLNSKHVSGEFDALGREKPFFNIVTAASNIWFRATDIDRSQIKVRPTSTENVLVAFVASVFVQDWMRKENFGAFLNDWGRVLSRYCSAIVKFVEKDGRLIPSVTPWNRVIVDQIDFSNNPNIEILELTEAQLRKNKSYDKTQVKALLDARKERQTINRQRKDNKPDYVKLYEVHGEMSLACLTDNPKDADTFVQQMQVISFVETKKRGEYQDFSLYKGREKKDPSMITHLIKEDGRTLAIGPVEHLFQVQWMQNHNAKNAKDYLDLACKLVYQTADNNFVGQNALTAVETGDILVHAVNMPLTQIQNNFSGVVPLQNSGQMWKALGNEIVGISESMLGVTAPSGTAWRQVDALLQENHSLFELMGENKGLYIEQMFKEFIFPFLKKKMAHSKEIGAVLEAHDIQKIDSIYVKKSAIKAINRKIIDKVLNDERVTPEDQDQMMQEHMQGTQEGLAQLGSQRYFVPSDVDDTQWQEIFDELDEVEVDVTGEGNDVKSALATLNTALQVVMNPAYESNKQAQYIVAQILEKSGTLSPMQLDSLPKATLSPMQPTQPTQPTQTTPPTPQAVT